MGIAYSSSVSYQLVLVGDQQARAGAVLRVSLTNSSYRGVSYFALGLLFTNHCFWGLHYLVSQGLCLQTACHAFYWVYQVIFLQPPLIYTLPLVSPHVNLSTHYLSPHLFNLYVTPCVFCLKVTTHLSSLLVSWVPKILEGKHRTEESRSAPTIRENTWAFDFLGLGYLAQ